MTKIRVFPHNEKGKIEFTKEELQKLLNEVYNEGKMDSYTIYYGSSNAPLPYYGTTTASSSSILTGNDKLNSLTVGVKY